MSRSPGEDQPTGSQSPESAMSYQFINLVHPSDTKDQKARRTIRSHVTKQQHQRAEQQQQHQRAEQIAAAARRSRSEPYVVESTSTQGSSFPLSRPRLPETHSFSSPRGGSDASALASSPTGQHPFLDLARIYPSTWIPFLNPILETYAAFMINDVLGHDDNHTKRSFETVWMPFVMTNITLLHAVLLLATPLFSSSSGTTHTLDLLHLKDMAIESIKKSLGDPAASTSDSTIAAIATMVQHEAFKGDFHSFSTHKSGLQLCIRQRGGLSVLGLEGLLAKVLLAIDSHTARTTGFEISV